MKFISIICVLIIVIDSIQMRSLESSDEVETDLKYDSKIRVTDLSPEEGQVSAKIKNNTNRSSLKSQVPKAGDSRLKNRPMPKIQRKEAQRGPSFVPSTRRPIMKTRKFTTKPHTVYHVQSNEQRNYSRRRQSNSSKRFRHQNERHSNQIKSTASESVNDRFKDFKDSDELEQNKNTVPTARVRSLIPAASEKFMVRTLPNKNDTIDNMFRSKAKLAIEESLQKFKGVKPVTKGKIINTDSPSENRSIKPIISQDVKKSKAKTKNIPNNPLQSTTDKIVTSTISTEKLDEMESIIIIKTEIPKISITTTPKFDYSIIKSEKIVVESTIPTTEKSRIPVSTAVDVVTENSENPFVVTTITTTEKSNIPISKAVEVVTEKSNIPSYKAEEVIPEKAVLDSNITDTKKSNVSVSESVEIVPEKSVIDSTIITTEKSIAASKAVEIVPKKSVADSAITENEKSNVPPSEPQEIIADNKLASLEEKAESYEPIVTKEIVMNTEMSLPNNVDILLAIKEIEQLLTRRKRANNIIEEEPVLTTSYGLVLNRRESPINVDFSYNNIHV